MERETREMIELVSAECKRVDRLLSELEFTEDGMVNTWTGNVVTELKKKMHELRRDTVSLEKMLYRR